MTAVDRIEALGRAGVTVSICCGPSEAMSLRWSVALLFTTGQECGPFAANNFDHAVHIAEVESGVHVDD